MKKPSIALMFSVGSVFLGFAGRCEDLPGPDRDELTVGMVCEPPFLADDRFDEEFTPLSYRVVPTAPSSMTVPGGAIKLEGWPLKVFVG